MKIIFYRNEKLFLLMILFLLSCNQSRKQFNNKLPYSKVEIYCACIVTVPTNIGNIVMSNCSSPSQKPPARFINPKVLYYSTSDSSIVNSFKRMFFDSEYITDTLIGGTDARFVVLMKRNDFIADTFVFRDHDHGTFSFNEKYNFKYNFTVIDSIRKILKMDEINCDGRE